MDSDRLPDDIEVALSIFCDQCAASLSPGAVNDEDICKHCPALRRAILAEMMEAKADEHASGDDVHLCYGIPECEVVQDYRARARALREGR